MSIENLAITTPDGVAEALLCRPDQAAHPGVVMYPDAIGLRPAWREMAERIASWGYIVLVPNYFYRAGSAAELAPTADLRTADWAAAVGAMGIRERIGSVTPANSTADASVFIEALRSSRGVIAGDIATVGYCFGGIHAIRAAQSRPDAVAAVGVFHTGNLVTEEQDSVHRHFDKARAEFYFGHADRDHTATPETIAAVEASLADAGLTYRSELYDDAAHGYAVPDLWPYREPAAERHYAQLRALLDRTIGERSRTADA